jgi:hypothetical protein
MSSSSRWPHFVACLSFALCLVVAGCGGGSPTKENYAKIKDGMTESEVNGILGSPSESKELLGNKISMWKSGDNFIRVAAQ